MVEVIYNGRLGNNLFQYCFGRIIAEQLGYKLKADPIPGFINTGAVVDGKDYSNASSQVLTGHIVDLNSILRDKTERKIIINGFFQRYEYYRAYKNLIKNNWLLIERSVDLRISNLDLALYIRRGDYLREGQALPVSFYMECLKKNEFNRLFICTDDPYDPFMLHFRKYRPVICSTPGDPLTDFKFLMGFKKIVQSASSFSWWAAFLSDAREIYSPVQVQGYWSEGSNANLTVTDEQRYKYIKCQELYKPSLIEKTINGNRRVVKATRDFLYNKIKRPYIQRTAFRNEVPND